MRPPRLTGACSSRRPDPGLKTARMVFSFAPCPGPAVPSSLFATACLVAPHLLQPRMAPATEPVKPITQRILLIIVLMVFLCAIEDTRVANVGCNRTIEALLELALRGVRRKFLLVVRDENGR